MVAKKAGDMTVAELVEWCSYDNCFGCPMGEPGDYGGITCLLKGLHPCEVTADMLDREIEIEETKE